MEELEQVRGLVEELSGLEELISKDMASSHRLKEIFVEDVDKLLEILSALKAAYNVSESEKMLCEPMSFSEAYKKLLDAHGYKQIDLANMLGTSQAAAQKLFNNANPTLKALGKYLGPFNYKVLLAPSDSESDEPVYEIKTNNK